MFMFVRLGNGPVRLIVPVTEKLIVSVSPVFEFASSIAARKVHAPPASAQTPLRIASGVSARELTVNVLAACAFGSWETIATATEISRTAVARKYRRLLGGNSFIEFLSYEISNARGDLGGVILQGPEPKFNRINREEVGPAARLLRQSGAFDTR